MHVSDIQEAIFEAAYGELNHHITIYQRTSDLDNYLRLMHPDHLVEFIANASDNLSHLGMKVIRHMYETNYNRMYSAEKISLQPSFELQREFQSNLLIDSNKIQMDIDHYGTIFFAAVERIECARKGSGQIGGAAIGGVIGCVFGPVGAFLGGLAGTAIADGATKDDAKLVAEKLAGEFKSVLELTNSFLHTMAERTVSFLANYENLLIDRG